MPAPGHRPVRSMPAVLVAGTTLALIVAAVSSELVRTLALTAAAALAGAAVVAGACQRQRDTDRELHRELQQVSLLVTELALARVASQIHSEHFPQAMQIAYMLEDSGPDDMVLRDAAADSMAGLRAMSMALDAPDYTISTLGSSLLNAQQAIGAEYDLEVTWHWPTVEHTISVPAAVLTYRFVQECLLNTARHATTASATVAVDVSVGHLTVEVSDDGTGFTYQAPGPLVTLRSKPRQVGLEILRARVESAGGQFAVATAPGAGTRVRAQIPVSDSPPRVTLGSRPTA